MKVWDEDHPAPEGGEAYERELLRQIDRANRQQMAALVPRDARSLEEYRRVVGGAFRAITGRGLPESVEREKRGRDDRDGFVEFRDLLRLEGRGEVVPLVSLYPESGFAGEVVVWVHGEGKDAAFDASGEPEPEVVRLLEAGVAVLTPDLFRQGESLAGAEPVREARVVKNPRVLACYTHCYNDSLFARRVHDLLTVFAFVRADDRAKQLHVVGLGGAGPHVALASAIAGGAVNRRVIDTEGFRFDSITSFRDPAFLPGAVKYGDLPAMLSLSAPHPLTLLGEDGAVPELVDRVYDAARGRGNVTSSTGERADSAERAVTALGAE